MHIGAASPGDREGILRLYGEFNEERIASGVGDAQYKTIDGGLPWESTLDDEDCMTYVGKEKSFVAGFITLRLPEFNPFHKVGRLAEVDLMTVERKLRRRGIGSALYRAAEIQMKTVSVTHILLNVKVGNVPAMLFWSKMGFKKVSKTQFKRADGIEERTIYMVKKI